ncbi:hypothetical protein LguiA_005240 [Lonicera macranthoides]
MFFSCLILLDGVFHEQNNQLITSSPSPACLARRLFDQYTQSILIIDKNSGVPGLAFKNRLPYIQLNAVDLPGLNVILMGCKAGEIEMGLSISTQVNIETEMRNLFPEDLSQQDLPRNFSGQSNQNQASSSSSTLRSATTDSLNYAPFQFTDNSNCLPFQLSVTNNPRIQKTLIEPAFQPPLRPVLTKPTTSTTNNPFHEATQALNLIINPKFPTLESVDAIMTKAMLAVITSSPSLSDKPQKAGAFQSYRSESSPVSQMRTMMPKQNMFKQSIKFFSRLNQTQNQEKIQMNRSKSTQLEHVMSERNRRKKLNERFQALTSLVPPKSKKDKTSVLCSATKYLASLKAQVEELSRRNHMLEARLPRTEATSQEISGSSSERLEIMVTKMEESTSKSCVVNLEVNVRGECSMLDLVIRVLEFVKQVKNLSILSIQVETRRVEASSIKRIILRLKIKEGEWDAPTFQEAVRRVVDDMAH